MVGVAVAVSVVVAGVQALSPGTMTVAGSVTVRGMLGYVSLGDGCGSAAQTGSPVTIYNDAGTIVGTTTLTGTGTATSEPGPDYSSGYANACRYAFSVADVPTDSKFYRVQSGGGAAGGVTFSAEEIQQGANIVVSD